MSKNCYTQNEPETIQKMFGTIARKYDRTNAILSFNLHKIWNRRLVEPIKGFKILDLCCGTGEIAYTWLQNQKFPKEVFFLDFCPEMLEVAKKRAVAKHKLKFIQGDAQKIPLPDHSVEHVTVAYGIRNVKDPSLCFKEVHRVLKPNGTFNILELTEPDNKIIRTGHRLYLTKILPFMGGLITANPSAYSYLSSSIQNFVKPGHLKKLLEESGFKNVTLEPLNFGVAHILRAAK